MEGSASSGGGKMRRSIVEFWDLFGNAIILGVTGASLQCLRGPWRGWKNFLLSNATAAFSSIICMSILPQYLPGIVSEGIAGMIGYSGGTLIDAVIDRARREIETRDLGDGGK